MGDILDESAQTSPVSLDDLIEQHTLPDTLPPEASVRNRAATTALLSENPEKAVDNYQLMRMEGQVGKDDTYSQVRDTVLDNTRKMDMQGVMSVLGDKNIPLEKKLAAVENIKNSNFLKDTGNVLHHNLLAKASEGENADNEAARISTVDALREIYESRNTIQGLVNAHGASLKPADGETFLDMLGIYFVPFGNSMNVAKVSNALRKETGEDTSFWKSVKDFALPGSTTMDIRKKLEQLPPAKQVEFTQKLLKAISENSGVIMNDNQFAQFEKASQIFEEGGYSNVDKFLDNVAPLLDLFGLRVTGKAAARAIAERGIAGAAKEAVTPRLGALEGVFKKKATAVEQAVSKVDAAKPETVNVMQSELERIIKQAEKEKAPDVEVALKHKAIQHLEDTKAKLLGEAGNLAEPGVIRTMTEQLDGLKKSLPASDEATIKALTKERQAGGVKYKEARAQIEKEIADKTADIQSQMERLTGQIESNRKASIASQQIDSLDKQIASLKKGLPDSPGLLSPVADAIRRIDMNTVVHVEHPNSPAFIIGQANPEKARMIHNVVFNSTGDEVAQALHGTSKADAMAASVTPQVTTEAGKVVTKTPDIDRVIRKSLTADEAVKMEIANNGALYYTDAEKAAARALKVNDFRSAEGLEPIPAMGGVRGDVQGSNIIISGVYGTPNGAFSNAADAISQAKYALRHAGLKDEEITLLKKEGLDHVPTTLEAEAGKEGNYLIRVDYKHEINPSDVLNFDKVDVKKNFFDRIAPLVSNDKGSLSRWIFDASSMLHEVYTGAASRVADATARFDKLLLNKASEFSDQFMKLAKDRRAKVEDYIREANYNGIVYDPNDLVTRGFKPEEISTIKSWREFWDGHFYLENYDLVRGLNAQGYQVLDNGSTKLFAKRIEKNQNIGRFLDPATGSIVNHSKADGDALYNAGGHYAKLRRPIDVNGQTIEHILVRNTPTEYLRAVRDSDQVLNYRPGYFQIQYKAPRFVDEIVIDANGNKVYKTVAVAGDTAEANHFIERMKRADPTKEYAPVRGDDRALKRDVDSYWDVQASMGRISQRMRGQLLEDASGLNHLGDGSYVMHPVKSAEMAAKSIAGRTVSRPMLDAAKARFIDNFKDVVKLPSDGMGGVRFPKSVDEIISTGKHTSSEIADARTTFEYIHFLENGYINSMDNVMKWGFNAIADMAGQHELSTVERAALNMSEKSLSHTAKGTVFMSYIGSNFLRQAIVQAHQVVRTVAYNPRGFITGNIPRLWTEYTNILAGAHIKPSAEGQAFYKFVQDSGMLDAVDRNNLVRGTLMAATETSHSLSTAKRVARAPLKFAQVAGFDMGERANLVGHLAAVYDRYKAAGKDLTDLTVRDKAYSEARAISYDMNMAGDMPYNQTTPAIVLQFMQVPHKAMLQAFNRRIPLADRVKLIATDLFMWGTPTATVGYLMGKDLLPEDAEMREIITWGAESWALNKMFTEMTGEKQNVDFSSLAPYELSGWSNFATALWETGIVGAVTNSPAGQFYTKDGGRVRNAIGMTLRFFSPFEEQGVDKPTFWQTANEVAKIASGWNNAYKAHLLLETRKKLDSYGNITDDDVTKFEAMAQAFGFGTSDTRDLYRISKLMSNDIKDHKKEVKQVYDDIRRYYATTLEVPSNDPKFITAVTGFALNKYKDDVEARKLIVGWIKQDLSGKDNQMMQLILKRSGIPTLGNVKDQIKQLPISEERKAIGLQRVEDMEKLHTIVKNEGNN